MEEWKTRQIHIMEFFPKESPSEHASDNQKNDLRKLQHKKNGGIEELTNQTLKLSQKWELKAFSGLSWTKAQPRACI